MSTSSETLPVDSSTLKSKSEVKPLWSYVTIADGNNADGGGNKRWKCRFCENVFVSSYTRLRDHLLKKKGGGIRVCSKVPDKVVLEMKKKEEESQKADKDKKPMNVPLPPSSLSFGEQASKKRKGPLEHAFNVGAREQLDAEIGRMFFSSGTSLNLSRNPHYHRSYTMAANSGLSGYKPPNYNKLRTTQLQKERAHLEMLLSSTKAMWSDKGVSIVSDGWSDSQRRPLINFIAVVDGQPIFLKAVDCSGEIKDRFFIANLLREVINEIGHEKVVQVITDNAPNCKAAGLMIEAEFPNIVWTPCVVHTLNLALKNICHPSIDNVDAYTQCNWISQVALDVSKVRNFINNHNMRLSMFNEFVSLKLLTIAETRFASLIVMLKRFKLIKRGLQAMVISEKWSLYRDDDVIKAKEVKDLLLNDEWWDSLEYILDFTRPIYDMLRECDTDKPCLHLVYDMWDTMIEDVRKVIFTHEGKNNDDTSPFYDVVYKILIDRWNKNNTPLHCLAHSLNPRYYSEQWLGEDSSRVPPHLDSEISSGRAKCLKKYFHFLEDRNKINIEFLNFVEKKGAFSEYDAIVNQYSMDPKGWWLLYGYDAPLLQMVASKILSQPSSSSCAERNWSTYSFIHSLKRNRLTPKRAEDLVYVHSNLRLLSRRAPEYKQGDSKMWDIGGDNFDTFEDVDGLDMANLSLDEPELEAFVVGDDNVLNVGEDMVEVLNVD